MLIDESVECSIVGRIVDCHQARWVNVNTKIANNRRPYSHEFVKKLTYLLDLL